MRYGAIWWDVMWCGGMWWWLSPRNSEVFRLNFVSPFSEEGFAPCFFCENHMPPWVEFKDSFYTNIMTPHCGNANEFLDGSAAARWEWRIHQIVILSGRFRVKRLPGTPLQSWDVQFQTTQFLTAGSRSCVAGAQGCYCCSWPYLDQHRHQRQEELRKTHPLQWSSAVFGGGLPPVRRPFQW